MSAGIQGVRPDLQQLGRYREVCGYSPSSDLPITYPHVMATPLHTALVMHARFPYPVLGIVHVRQVITVSSAMPQDERYSIHCRIEHEREARRGLEFDLVTEMRRGGDLVWEGITTVLVRTRKPPPGLPRPAKSPDAALAGAPHAVEIVVSADMGRRYAHVTRDYNPIHLHPLTSRPFGFRAPIVHGMWSLARVCAELESALPPLPLRLEAEFRSPLALPAIAMLRHTAEPPGGRRFVLEPGSGRAYLRGSVTAHPGINDRPNPDHRQS